MPIELQTNLALECEPVDPSHVVNIRWVEQFFTGKVKAPVRVVSTVDLDGTPSTDHMTFVLTAAGPLVIDGVTLAVNDRVLLQGQANPEENGIYVVGNAGNGGPAELDRAADFADPSHIFTGVTIAVNQGTNHANTTWKLTSTGPFDIGVTGLDFISVTPTTGTAKYAETITGDGTETEFDIDHSLGTQDVSVSIRNLSTHGIVLADVTTVDNNTVEIGFCKAPEPSDGPYRVTVIG